jgi:hypothetical protein
MSHLMTSKVTLGVAIAYLIFSFGVTLTWYIPQLGFLMPRWLESWIYPVDKTDLDILRFAHFLALAVLTLRFVPPDWPPLRSRWAKPMIVCGQNSLEIFCIGVFLAFAGHFILAETSGGAWLHLAISVAGIVIMTAVAWLLSWYKGVVEKSGGRAPSANADLVGGGP